MDLEHDFAVWADRGDPDALTRVFDAMAGRLLLLAAHLTASGATAEDLVQATFLAAMRSNATWDRRRPLWPWLAAILQNEAHMLWRRQQRRREVGIEAAASSEAQAADPARLVASEEAFAAIVQAIDALPLPYRQVLRLRLVHGLEPIEIARALEVPVGTVRAQVHRGLAQLREALPAGVAMAAAVWLTGDGVLLAQVREQVLAEAAAMQATAAALPGSLLLATGGTIVQAKSWALVAAGAALILVLGLALVVPPLLGTGEQQVSSVAPVSAHATAEPSRPNEDADRAERRAAEVVPRSAWPLVVTVRTPAGEPVEGASIDVRVGPPTDRLRAIHKSIAAGATTADGTFHCALDPLRQRSALFRRTTQVHVTAAHPKGRAEWRVLALPRTTEPQPFAIELKVAPAIGLIGRVIDGSGAPVAGAELHGLHSRRHVMRTTFHERSSEDGSFRIHVDWEQDTLWAGGIAAAHPSHGIGVGIVPRSDTPPSPGTTLDLGSIVLAGRSSIRGQVVLGDGSGLGQFPLVVQQIDPRIAEDPVAVAGSFFQEGNQREPLQVRKGQVVYALAQPTTAADGSFACAGLDPDAVYAVGVRDARLQFVAVVARPGGEPVRLVVERQLLLLDTRDELGELLPGAQSMAEGFDPEGQGPADRIRPGFPEKRPSVRAPAGFYPADGRGRRMLLSRFGWVWRIGSFDDIAQPDFLRHDVIAGVHRAERTLVLRPETRFGALHLVVADERGQPLQRYGSELRCLDRDLSRNNGRGIGLADVTHRDLPAGRWRLTVDMGAELLAGMALPDYLARGSHEQEVLIEDGKTTEVKVEAKPKGRIAFLLRADTPPAGGFWEDLRIQDATGSAVAFYLYNRAQPQLSEYRPRLGWLLPSQRAFAPGKHAFRITAKGYDEARCEIEVVADKLVQADVVMRRQ